MFAGLMGIECHSSSVRQRSEVTEGKTVFFSFNFIVSQSNETATTSCSLWELAWFLNK